MNKSNAEALGLLLLRLEEDDRTKLSDQFKLLSNSNYRVAQRAERKIKNILRKAGIKADEDDFLKWTLETTHTTPKKINEEIAKFIDGLNKLDNSDAGDYTTGTKKLGTIVKTLRGHILKANDDDLGVSFKGMANSRT